MATITVMLEDEVYIDAHEWLDSATEDDIKEMFNLCKGHFQNTVGTVSTTIQEAEFQAKLRSLQDRYLSLSPEQIQLILSI